MRGLLQWGILIGSAIWVGIDSRKLRIPVNKKPYSLNNGALAWFLTCCIPIVWFGMFPFYLYRRSKALKAQAKSSTMATVLGLVVIVVEVVAVFAFRKVSQ